MEFQNIAVDITYRSDHRLHQHGALLIKGRDIVSVGYNDRYHHAEEKAILNYVERVLQGERKQVIT